MITNPQQSLAKLDSFFKNESSFTELNLPELIRIDSNTSEPLWNRLIINNPNLTFINLPNMQQSPYILEGSNLLNINLDSLQTIEFERSYFPDNNNNLLTSILRDTKIQTLNLPNFKGTTRPLPAGSDDIATANNIKVSFWNNYWLSNVSLGNSIMNQSDNSNYKFNGFWFRNNYFLKYLQLRYPYVIPLVRTAGFNTTPIGSGDKGRIYVPKNLVTAYKSADNWSSFKDKIFSLEDYERDILADQNNYLDKTWEQLLIDCSKSSILGSEYELGKKMRVKIHGVPIDFILVGKNQDILAEDNTKTAHSSWLGVTIADFTTNSVNSSFDNTNPRQYSNALEFRQAVTRIYEGLEDIVKDNIKPVKKFSKGFNINGDANDYASIETGCWPPSAVELGIKTSIQAGAFTYDYFKTDPWSKIDYRLGDTNINEVDGQKICVALRDYTNNSSNYPDLLRSINNAEHPMEIVTNNSTRPYLIIGFCI